MLDTEYERQENFLEKTRAIFAEREQEFRLRELDFEKREAALNMALGNIAAKQKEAEAKRRETEEKASGLQEKELQLEEWQKKLNEQQEALDQRRTELDEQEKNQLLKYNLELEQVRNEEMKLKRLRADYEYKLSLMDQGVAEALEHVDPVPDPEHYISVEEHNNKIHLMEERMQNLVNKRDELEASLKEMQKERGKLLNKIVELQSSRKETIPGPDGEQQEEPEETKVQGAGQTERRTSGITSETEEELTAGVLQSYLAKNRTEFEQLEIRHSEDGELLHAECRGLTYHFLFTDPATFDISAKRKNSSRLRRQLESCNERFPGVQFRYDETEGCVYATGYFTNQLKGYELMRRVQEIADCFRQE